MGDIRNPKTLEGQFLMELQNDFGFTPVVAQALLSRSKEILGGLPFQVDQPQIGQMKVLAVSKEEPAGKPLSQCKMVCINLTVNGGEDDLVTLRENGAVALRRVILCRIVREAIEQGTYLTEEDAARILLCDVRTIKRDIGHFRKQGIYLPLRGYMINTGRGQTHKIMIVKWYIQGMTFTEIITRSHHSVGAISRYIDMFGRVAVLVRRNLSPVALAQVMSISVSLAEEYVRLYHDLNIPENQDQINRIVDRVKIPTEAKVEKKRRVK